MIIFNFLNIFFFKILFLKFISNSFGHGIQGPAHGKQVPYHSPFESICIQLHHIWNQGAFISEGFESQKYILLTLLPLSSNTFPCELMYFSVNLHFNELDLFKSLCIKYLLPILLRPCFSILLIHGRHSSREKQDSLGQYMFS